MSKTTEAEVEVVQEVQGEPMAQEQRESKPSMQKMIIGMTEEKFQEFQKLADVHTEAAKIGVLDYKSAYGQTVNFLMENLFKSELK